jgi:mono/diheme cytochrome c family protein
VSRRALGIALAFAFAAGGAAAAPPQQDYVLQCMGCHREDGSGAPGRVPSLVGQMGRFLRVPGGRAYLVQVPGAAQSTLDDAALAALLDWMLRTFSPAEIPPGFTSYRADEVARYRAERPADVAKLRAELLERIARAR